MRKSLVIVLILIGLIFFQSDAMAQCSMCSANAEMGIKEGNTQTKGINTGILYLLAIPYLLLTGIGVIWYRNYRKKNFPKAV